MAFYIKQHANRFKYIKCKKTNLSQLLKIIKYLFTKQFFEGNIYKNFFFIILYNQSEWINFSK